jgi:hypothetical protein
VSEHDELDRLLHKIAATVGDPPEHGLERVDARRRRRTRHRRGAVAAAVALAVGAIAAVPFLAGEGGEGGDLTAVGSNGQPPTESEKPDVVELYCNPSRVQVPVAYIRPQRDGMHLLVHNGFAGDVDVWVTSEGRWDSGRFTVPPGDTTVVQPVPPGEVYVGCSGLPDTNGLLVNLDNPDGFFKAPGLDCGSRQHTLTGRLLPKESRSVLEAGRLAAVDFGFWRDGHDRVDAATGYREADYGYATTTTRVRILRDGETIAFVNLEDASPDDGRPDTAPWTTVTSIDICDSVTNEQSPTSTATSAPPVSSS